MIAEPRFGNEDDSGAGMIMRLVDDVAAHDPEFILKLAVYLRQDLNIRSTSNFLVALAANNPECAPFLKKYFKFIVRLPSDWLDCAALYQMLPNRKLSGRALPTSLRKAMKFKFTDFDTYQLGKYNKAGKIKRKKKKERLLAAQGKAVAKTSGKSDLTMKQMIRQLHISQPVNNVMCLLGKKYPATQSEFYASGLRGTFDQSRAGKRMKLPVPETWETMLSAKGNKAETWEELMDHRKLPFMAMLRNIRNLILTGVDYKYHRQVWGKLNDENSIARSRQFPFRFFSAYQALDIDVEKLRTDIKEAKERLKAARKATAEEKAAKAAERQKKGAKFERRKKVIIPKNMPDEALLRKYREALDNAVKFATIYNVKPIRGNTVVFCLTSSAMRVPARGTRGMGSARTLQDMGVLLGLMCKYMCEQCDFRIFASAAVHPKSHLTVTLKDGTILDNMAAVAAVAASGQLGDGFQFPFDYLEDLIRDKVRIDNFIIMSDKTIAPGQIELEGNHPGGLESILKKYRQQVNPDLLYVSVNLAGQNSVEKADADYTPHPNDVMISGFSDSILKYIAERGDSNQLHYIDHIDQAKNIKKPLSKAEKEGSRTSLFSFSSSFSSSRSSSYRSTPRKKFVYSGSSSFSTNFSLGWGDEEEKKEEVKDNVDVAAVAAAEREKVAGILKEMKAGNNRTVRLFVSSTFRDMHGERDYLVRYIFPELRQRCKKRQIDFYDVDLRWGVTEKEAEDGGAVEVCLQEVDRCRPFFLGILGDRYGWTPGTYQVSDDPRMRWVRNYPQDRSVTELEMYYGALRDPDLTQGFFYFRDSSFASDVPEEFRNLYVSEGEESAQKMTDLKKTIQKKFGAKEYSVSWGGVKEGKPMTSSLEKFGRAVLEDLWKGICKTFPDAPVYSDPWTRARDLTSAFIDQQTKRFVGRKNELKELTKYVKGDSYAPFVVHGGPGCGKSALLAKFSTLEDSLQKETGKDLYIISHHIGVLAGSTDIRHSLFRICNELKEALDLSIAIPEEYKELRTTFPKVLEEASYSGTVILIIDGLNQLDEIERAHSLDWLPAETGKVKLILGVWEKHTIHDVLAHRKPAPKFVKVGPLEENHRKSLVTSTLADYRKKLDDSPGNNQLRFLLRKTDSSLPLYLVVACEELRVFGVYEELTRKIKSMAQTLDRLFEEVLRRMESDYDKVLLRTTLCILACSRRGVSEHDLLRILSPKDQEELSYRIWSPLIGGLEAYLRTIIGATGESSLTFFHGQMEAAVTKKYLSIRNQAASTHKLLAEYFLKSADPAGDGSFSGDALSISELPYHLLKAGMIDELEGVVCNLRFVERKCKLDMTFDLVNDLANAVSYFAEQASSFSRWGEEEDKPQGQRRIEEFHRFLSSNAAILSVFPDLVYQQASNQPAASAPALAAQELGKSGPWIKWSNKPRGQNACLLTLAGSPTDGAMACAYSPDGKTIVVASRDQTLKIYDAVTGIEKSTLVGHTNWVVACAYSPDGRSIVSGSWDNTVKVWDARAGVETVSFDQHSRRVNTVAFGNVGSFVASGSWDCSVIVWSLKTRKMAMKLYGHTKPVNSVSFSPDDSLLVSGSWDGTVKVWKLENRSCLMTLDGHEASVRSVRFSPSGTQIVSTSVDTTVVLWDARTGQLTHTLKGHSEPVNTCSFSADGKHLVSASDDLTVKVWDAQGGRQIGLIATGKEKWVSTCDYSTDDKRLAVAYSDLSIGVWDIFSQEEKVQVPNAHTRTISKIIYSPTNNTIATSSEDGIIKIWDSKTLAEVLVIKKHKSAVNGIAFSPDGNRLLSAGDDYSMTLFDLKDNGSVIREFKGHTNTVIDCAWSRDGKRVASVSRDRTVRIWDPETGAMKKVFKGHTDWVVSVAFSADSKKLVTGSWDFTIKLWDIKKGRELGTMEGHVGAISCVSFSHNGEFIASSSFDTDLKIWSVKDCHEITTMDGHSSRVNSCSFSKGGSTLASSSDDGTVRFWDSLAGQEITTLQGHSQSVNEVSFAPDKHRVASASGDGSVKIWDAAAEREIKGHSQYVSGCAFFEGGNRLATVSRDGTLKLWDTKTGHVIENIECDSGASNGVAVAPDGSKIVTAMDDTKLKLWRADGSGRLVSYATHGASARSASYSPSGKFIASASWDCNVYILDGSRATQVRKLTGHTDWVDCVEFAPNEQIVASAGHDCSIIMWNPFSGRQEKVLSEHQNWVTDIAFSPDSSKLVSASYDKSLIMWNVATGKAIAQFSNPTGIVLSCTFLCDGNYIAFGSQDSTIKIVKSTGLTKHSRNVILKNKEVAKFFCKAPVTSLSAVGSTLAAGDSLGNVYILEFES